MLPYFVFFIRAAKHWKVLKIRIIVQVLLFALWPLAVWTAAMLPTTRMVVTGTDPLQL